MEAWKSIWDRVPRVVNYVFMALTLALLSLLFPTTLRFKYTYEIGRAWAYEDLYAPFDFAIPKTADQLQAEQRETSAQSGIYYRLDDSIAPRSIQRFVKAFEEQLNTLEPKQLQHVQENPEQYQSYGAKLLERMYARGIVEWDSMHQDTDRMLRIELVSGNTLRQPQGRQLLTKETSIQLLRDSLPLCGLEEPGFLFPLLMEAIVPNITFDAALHKKFHDNVLSSVSPYGGMVQKDELIVPRGGMVTPAVFQMLEGYREQYTQGAQQQKSQILLFVGYFILTALILFAFLWYIRSTHRFVFIQFNHLIFVLIWPLVFGYLAYVIRVENILSPYMIPFAMVPLVLKNFYDSRIALYAHLVVVLIASLLSAQGISFLLLQVLVGMMVVVVRQDSLGWHRFFDLILFVFIVYCVGFGALALTEGGAWERIEWNTFSWLLMNSFILLLAYPLTSFFERVLGFTSVLRLRELSDTNRPLLQLLAQQAPGTFQHSLQVANLAEAVARSIGADHLMVRVAALYHDIGKIANPEYFIENQSGANPHVLISPLESARIIIDHVHEGLVLARKYSIPRTVADFIRTHHGSTRVEYFYRQYEKSNPAEAEAQEGLFRYPGPKPVSKEATILMLADTIEAACKSIKEPTGQEIDDMIDRLITFKIAQGQFEESALSFGELEQCKQVFRQQLRSIYHVRIEYPR